MDTLRAHSFKNWELMHSLFLNLGMESWWITLNSYTEECSVCSGIIPGRFYSWSGKQRSIQCQIYGKSVCKLIMVLTFEKSTHLWNQLEEILLDSDYFCIN